MKRQWVDVMVQIQTNRGYRIQPIRIRVPEDMPFVVRQSEARKEARKLGFLLKEMVAP